MLSAGVKTTEVAVCCLVALTRPVGGYYSAWANGSRDLLDLLGGRRGLKGPLALGGLQHTGLAFEEERRLEKCLWWRRLNNQDSSTSLSHSELGLNSDPTA